MDETEERRQARIVWEALQHAADHLPPNHPAAFSIRRALYAAEAHWHTLAGRQANEDGVLATSWRRSSAD